MKKILIILPLTAILGLMSCEDQLNQNPPSDLSVDGFFRNSDDFEQAVNGIYQSMRGFPSRGFYLSDVRSDNFYGVGEAGVRDHEPVNNFATTLATNPYMTEAWNSNFQGIMRANTLLENLNATAVPDAGMRSRFEAEAKFFRAFYYFDLVKWFGEVPVVDHLVSPTEALDVGRSPVSDVYDLIISDLQFAIANLDEYYGPSSPDLGRATVNAARGILARVYLSRSGPDYGIKGPGMGTNEYSDALTQLNAIISSNHYSLLPSYADVFANDNEDNAEVIFDIQFESGGQGIGADYPGEMGSRAWWNSVGIPWAIGLENKDISEDWIASVDTANDTRFNTSAQLDVIDIANGDTTYDPTCVKYCTPDPTYWGVDRFDFPINFIVLRYADVLLMKAECILNGASGSQADVNTIVNDIRTRAGLSALPGDATMDDLLAERRREFLGEGLRWHDLVRSGNVMDVINAWIPVEDVKGQMSLMKKDFIIYPLPQAEMDVKMGLYDQNPGY